METLQMRQAKKCRIKSGVLHVQVDMSPTLPHRLCVKRLKHHQSIACIYARSQDAQNDAFFSTLTRSIEQEALKEGYIVKYSFSAYDIHTPATYNQIMNNEVDGAAILGRCDKETLKFMKNHFERSFTPG